MIGALALGLLRFAALPERVDVQPVPGWTSNGPDGGLVHLIAHPTEPSTLYAISSGGLLKTNTAGERWFRFAGNLPQAPDYFVLGPEDPLRLYALTGYGSLPRLFRSADGGSTWTVLQQPHDAQGLPAVDPSSSDTLFIFSEDPFLLGYCSLDRSDDGGQTWSSVFPCFADSSVSSLRFDPTNSNVAYAGILGDIFNRVIKSVDGGRSWFESGAGLPDGVEDLVIDRDHPTTLFAQVGQNSVFKTTDGGAHWQPTPAGLPSGPGTPVSLAYDRNSQSVYLATGFGLFRSLHGDEPWSLVSALPIQSLVLTPGAPSAFFAVGPDGVVASMDSGVTWIEADRGIHAVGVGALAISTSRLLFAASATNLFVSRDHGRSWTEHPVSYPNGTVEDLLAVGDPPVLFAATLGEGVQRSTNEGMSWAPFGTGLPQGPVYFILRTASGRFFVETSTGIFTLDEFGVWQPRSSGLPEYQLTRLVADATDPDVLYVGTLGAGLYRTADGGITWAPAAGLLEPQVYELTADPKNSGLLYAAASDPNHAPMLWKSMDSGGSWTELLVPSANGPGEIAIDPSNVDRIYSTAASGLLRSDDGGSTWRPLPGGLDSPVRAYRLIVEPDGDWIHAATLGQSVLDFEVGRTTRMLNPR